MSLKYRPIFSLAADITLSLHMLESNPNYTA